MPVTPQISLVFTLNDLAGAQIGTGPLPAYVRIALCNYGPYLPRVSGTSLIAKIGPYDLPYVGIALTVTLWGNDVIIPVGTYYAISILDANKNVLQTGAYVFNGTMSNVDFSTLSPTFPTYTASVMGSEVTLPFSATPNFNCALIDGPVTFNMVLTGNVTSSTLVAPFAGQIVIFKIQQDATGGRTFAWPPNVVSPGTVISAPNAITTQAFVADINGNLYAIAGNALASLAATALIGDVLRFNTAGDGNWDTVNLAAQFCNIYCITGGSLTGTGPGINSGLAVFGSGGASTIASTATLPSGERIFSSSTASLNNVIGFASGENGSNTMLPLLAWYRFSMKIGFESTSNCRYWLGLFTWVNLSPHGNNGANVGTGLATYATDTPNKNTIAFRYSAGVDTHWQAVVCTGGGSQTTVDTGVTPDTGVHLFEMATNAAGTSIQFFIDGVLVATISTNIPATDMTAGAFFTGDNKNTANVVAGNFYWVQWSLK